MKKFTILLPVLLLGYASLIAQEFVIDYHYHPAKGQEKNIAIMYFGGSGGGYPYDPFIEKN